MEAWLADGGAPGRFPELVAEALRAVNQVTIMAPSPGTPGWEDIGDIYRVLAEVGVLVERIPQAIDQLCGHLQNRAMWSECRSDSGATLTSSALLASATDDLAPCR